MKWSTLSRSQRYSGVLFACGAVMILLNAIFGAGCSTVTKATKSAADVAAGAGYIDQEDANSIGRVADSAEKAFTDITPEQEYYLGRAVAADLLQQYPPLDNTTANNYLNQLGQTLARFSDRPETYAGYHFLLLDSDEINAFAAPSGLILITRGMVRLCHSEDALAAVLAHEIGHVVHRHGLQAIDRSRLVQLFSVVGQEGVNQFGDAELKQLMTSFEGSIADVTKTLLVNGYQRGQESEADAAAVKILTRIGYNPSALVDMLTEMQKDWQPGGLGFGSTHPAPDDRIQEVRPSVAAFGAIAEPNSRHQRFLAAVGTL